MRNGPQITTRGLVLSLDAADKLSYPGTGTIWRDTSGNDRISNLVGGTTFNSNNQGSFTFDGADDRVEIPYSSFWDSNVFGNATNFTISCWAKCNSFFNWSCLIQKSPDIGWYSNSEGASIWVDASGFVAAFYNGESGNPTGGGTAMAFGTSNTSKWFNLAFTGDGTNLNFYVDGSLVATSLVSFRTRSVISSTNGPKLGVRGGVTSFFNGQIAYTLFYTRGLAATEIAQNFNALRGRFGL